MSQHQADGPGNPQPSGREARREVPRFKLILHAGKGADVIAVVRTIMDLTHFCQAEATHRMWEAHHSGRSQLLVTHGERAELYVEQFAQRGLRVTLEPA